MPIAPNVLSLYIKRYRAHALTGSFDNAAEYATAIATIYSTQRYTGIACYWQEKAETQTHNHKNRYLAYPSKSKRRATILTRNYNLSARSPRPTKKKNNFLI